VFESELLNHIRFGLLGIHFKSEVDVAGRAGPGFGAVFRRLAVIGPCAQINCQKSTHPRPSCPWCARTRRLSITMGWHYVLETPAEESGSDHSEWKREIAEEVGSPTLCTHAFSIGGIVYRIRREDEATTSNDDDENSNTTRGRGSSWWTWQKVVEPGAIVTHVSSNWDGSVIVAATDAGTIALLRGRDGRRIASQRVVVLNVQWTTNSSLCIETNDAIILVDQIDGETLNHETDERAVSRATRQLAMTNVSLGNYKLRTFAILSSRKVIACDVDGRLQLLEIRDGALLPSEATACFTIDGEIDYGVGLHQQEKAEVSVVVGCTLKGSDRILFWFDAKANKVACSYTLENVIVADDIRPLDDSHCAESLSMAVATRSSAGAQIHVLQVLTDDETVAQPHCLYTIAEDVTATGMILAPMSLKECAFRYRVWTKSGQSSLKAFEPDQISASRLRRVRSLLVRKDVDALSDDLIVGLGDNAFSRFHPSEIEFARLERALSQEKGAAEVSQLVRKLLAGARTSPVGLDWLVQGIKHVIQTPSNFNLQQFHAGIGLLPRLMQPLGESLNKTGPVEDHAKLLGVVRSVERKAQALKYIVECKLVIDFPFSQVRSIRHLYEVLVQEGRIADALALAAKDLVSLEELVLPVLQTRPVTMKVVPLLRDAIFPRLSIGDAIVSRVKHWAVQSAEQVDDIDQSVKLLEVRVYSSLRNRSADIARCSLSTAS
jgi:hypothetical protein